MPGVIRVYASLHEGDFHTVGLSEDVPIAADWQDYRYEFQAGETTGKRLRFGIGLGLMSGKLYLKEVALRPKKD